MISSFRAGGEPTNAPKILAHSAYQATFDAEPTDPQILWERAQNLRRFGRIIAAQALVRCIAEGTWQQRFRGW